MIYQEYSPCPALSPWLACLWTCHLFPGADGSIHPVAHRVLPDNCIDILWQDSGPGAHVAGMMSSAITVSIVHPVRTFAVRFKPGAAAYFFDFPLHQMADLHPALDALWAPGLAAQFDDALWSRDQSDLQALTALQRLLLALLLEREGGERRPGLAEVAVSALSASHGALRVETLAATLGVSRQHLSNQFRARVGLGVKTFARVCRFRAASERIRATPAVELDWAALALDLGYYDQPHLIHEFRALCGSTPDTFIRRA